MAEAEDKAFKRRKRGAHPCEHTQFVAAYKGFTRKTSFPLPPPSDSLDFNIGPSTKRSLLIQF